MSRVSLEDLRFGLLCLGLLIYAFFGSPTPDNPSIVEAVIGLCLLLAVGFTALPLLFYKPDPSCRWLRLLFFCGILVTLIIGLLSAHDPHFILRDILPFLFLCLPLFFRSQIEKTTQRERVFMIIIWALGLIFGLRVLGPVYDILPAETELFYLANSPILMFTAICLAGFAFDYLVRNVSFKNILISMICAVLALICLWSMMLDVQRATISAVFISLAFLFLYYAYRKPVRIILPLFVFGVLSFIFSDVLQETFETLTTKTLQVGLNSRLDEAIAVFESASPSLMHILFGQGWGARFVSPAIAMQETAFTHSFLTYMFFKGGLVMLLLSMMVCISALLRIWNIWQRGDHVYALGLFWALMIPVFLYASHKSLDFGLVLLLIYALGTDRQKQGYAD